jgi:hypothetical protein
MNYFNKYHNYYFFTILLFVFIGLIFFSSTLSISYKESLIFFKYDSIISFLSNLSTGMFGHNNIALRLPFIIFYAFSSIMIYLITKDYFSNEFDRLLSTLVFMILPGFISAGLLLNNSIIVIFCLLLYLYYYKIYNKQNYILLILFVFIDNSFIVFYLAIFIYSLIKKDYLLTFLSIILLLLSIKLYGFYIGGRPRSHFFDTLASYSSILSPIIFLYYIYTIYRMGIKNRRTLYWYISATALIVSLLLSIRQKIYIEDFAPYIIITLPIVIKHFLHTLRIRLPIFRTKHYYFLFLSICFLIFSISVVFFNKTIYLFTDNIKKHFLYDYHFSSEISDLLIKNGINNIRTNYKLENKLKFYGIKNGNKYLISLEKLDNFDKKIDIKIYNRYLSIYILKLE